MYDFRSALCTAIVTSLIVWTAPTALAQPKPTAVRVAATPITNYTPLIVARDKG